MDKIKAFKWENILTAILYVVLGILLVMFPASIAKTLCYTIATVVTDAVGLLLVFNPFRAAKWMIRVVGICIALTGASDLISGIYFYRKMREYTKDMEALEQDYVEK